MNAKKFLKLTETYKTPFYVYDGEIIENQFKKISTAFSDVAHFQVNYAVKALSSVAILNFLKKQGAFLDTVSINEVKLALLAGFKPNEISYTPNGVSFDEILEVHKIGAHITLDNILQIKQFAKLNLNTPIGVRINPAIRAGAYKKIIVAGKSAKFGLALNNIDKLSSLVDKYNLSIDGFHIHLGSGIDNIDSFLKSAAVLFDVAKQFKNLQFINFGGGFKVKYHEDDSFLDIDEIGAKLSKAFNFFESEYGNTLKLIVEPGKFLVSQSGFFLAEITTIKKNNIFINSGFNDLMRPMYYKAYHHIKNISSINLTNKKQYNIVGYICEQDYFGKKRVLTKPHIGDIIVIENAGAYCQTMASNYNSRLRPMELFTYQGETRIIRKREAFDDLIQNQIF